MHCYLCCHAMLLLQWSVVRCPIKGCIEDKSSGDCNGLGIEEGFLSHML